MTELRKPAQIAADAQREALRSLVAECTEKQRAFFSKLFPGDIDSLSTEQLGTAIGLCQRTIKKNAVTP